MPGNVVLENKQKGDNVILPVKAATHIYRGSLVAVDATGYAVPADDAVGHKVMGVAEEEVNNAGLSGAASIRVRRVGIYKLIRETAALVTDLGKLAYVATPQGAATTQSVNIDGGVTNHIVVGEIVGVDTVAGEVWVDITKRFIRDTTGA